MKSNPYMKPGMAGMAVQYDPYVPRVQSSGKISYRDNIARMAVPVPYVEATHAQMLASPGDPAPAGAPAVAPAPAHQKPRGSATESAVLASLIAPVPLPQPQPDAQRITLAICCERRLRVVPRICATMTRPSLPAKQCLLTRSRWSSTTCAPLTMLAHSSAPPTLLAAWRS